jgi:hypothetical protein
MNKFAKITDKKIIYILIAITMLCSILVLTSCEKEPLVIKDSDTYIIIKTNEKTLADEGEIFLIDYMADLKENGELEYTINNGMISSINGIENPADFSKCWMLYTSDIENSNSAFGTVEYQGKEYGSAVVGAEMLKLKPDQIYIWVFKSFD